MKGIVRRHRDNGDYYAAYQSYEYDDLPSEPPTQNPLAPSWATQALEVSVEPQTTVDSKIDTQIL